MAIELDNEPEVDLLSDELWLDWECRDAPPATDDPGDMTQNDLCPDCGFSMARVKQIASGELYYCANCEEEHVRPLPFTEPMPELTEEQWRRLYQGGGNE